MDLKKKNLNSDQNRKNGMNLGSTGWGGGGGAVIICVHNKSQFGVLHVATKCGIIQR